MHPFLQETAFLHHFMSMLLPLGAVYMCCDTQECGISLIAFTEHDRVAFGGWMAEAPPYQLTLFHLDFQHYLSQEPPIALQGLALANLQRQIRTRGVHILAHAKV